MQDGVDRPGEIVERRPAAGGEEQLMHRAEIPLPAPGIVEEIQGEFGCAHTIRYKKKRREKRGPPAGRRLLFPTPLAIFFLSIIHEAGPA